MNKHKITVFRPSKKKEYLGFYVLDTKKTWQNTNQRETLFYKGNAKRRVKKK